MNNNLQKKMRRSSEKFIKDSEERMRQKAFIYCWCGLLTEKGLCPRHKEETHTFEEHQKIKRNKIEKWSGPSKHKYDKGSE